MKKFLPVIVGIVVFFLVVGGFLIARSKKALPPSTIKPAEETLIETPLEERPYVTLTPRVDGREFTLDIGRIKNAKTIEYELVYLSQGLSRGVIGSLDLNGETDISRKLLLGTCSKNVCKYDEGVTEGTLTLRFRGPDGTRKFVSDFHLQRGDKELNSINGKFKFTGKFSPGAFYMTMPTGGLPKEIEGKIIAGPYGVFTAASTSVKGAIKLRLTEKSPEAKVFGWDGTSWKEYSKGFETDGEVVSVEVDRLTTFIAVSP